MTSVKSLLNISTMRNILRTITIRDLNLRKLILFLKVKDYTMMGFEKLSTNYELSNLAEKRKIKGAFVECGCWKGGGMAVMAYNAQRAGSKRKIWMFDSFEGLPEPTEHDGNTAIEYAEKKKTGKLEPIGKCVASVDDVKDIFFAKLKLDPKNVEIRKGWFQDTVPKARKQIGDIAILRLDGDWYESEKCCIENLYDNVVAGGFIILDDYGTWAGSKKAMDEFLKKRREKPDLIRKKMGFAYFVKKEKT